MGLSRVTVAAFRVLLVVTVVVICFLAFTNLKLPVIDLLWDKLKHAAAFATVAWWTSLFRRAALAWRRYCGCWVTA